MHPELSPAAWQEDRDDAEDIDDLADIDEIETLSCLSDEDNLVLPVTPIVESLDEQTCGSQV